MSDDYGKDQYIKACLKAGDAEAAYRQLVNSGPWRIALHRLTKHGRLALRDDELEGIARAHDLRFLVDQANEEMSKAREMYVNSRPMVRP